MPGSGNDKNAPGEFEGRYGCRGVDGETFAAVSVDCGAPSPPEGRETRAIIRPKRFPNKDGGARGRCGAPALPGAVSALTTVSA